MNKALEILTFVCLAALAAMAQPRGGPQTEEAQIQPPQRTQPPANAQPVQANLNLIIAQIQRAALATNGDLGKLRIERWKTDNDQKEQLQKMADSIQRNVTFAIPGLISDVQNSHGSMATTFKLYHNITIVYEYLTSLTDAAGALGKREEFEPLANDAAALDSARQNLSTYIEQTASQLESRMRHRAPPTGAASAPIEGSPPSPHKGIHTVIGRDGVKRIVIEDEDADNTEKPAKKKTSKPSPTPSPRPK